MKKLFNVRMLLALLIIGAQVRCEIALLAEYEQVECELTLRKPRPFEEGNTHPRIPGRAAGVSDNWSGYAALTNLTNPTKGSVTYVAGTWNVPAISATPDDSSTAIWVGIDGYTSPSVEQLGTEHDWVNGKAQHSAWFEMYPNYSFNINAFPLNVGDSITATVTYKGNNVFVLTIMNNTQKKFYSVPTKYTTSKTAQRSSAEWIVEAPFSSKVLPLSHFSQINWTNCACTISNVLGSINHSTWQNDAITMEVDNTTIIKALPSALTANGTAFNVVWGHE